MGHVPPEREWYAIEMEYFPSVTLAQMLDQGEEGFVASYARLFGVFEKVLEGCAHKDPQGGRRHEQTDESPTMPNDATLRYDQRAGRPWTTQKL
jgi:hypothetical protein